MTFKRKVFQKYQIMANLDLPKIKWSYPTDKELLNEVHSEFHIEQLFVFDTWPKKEDYEIAVQDLKKASKPEELDPKALKGRHIWDSYAELHKTVKMFGLPKDPDSMLEAIKAGKPLPMPIVVKKLNGEMEILGGATRSGIAVLSNQKITALVIDEKKANELLADRMEKDTEKFSKNENEKEIHTKVKNYYFKNGEKPEFEDVEDQVVAHVAEYRYRKIAKLRGLPEREWLYAYKELQDKRKEASEKK